MRFASSHCRLLLAVFFFMGGGLCGCGSQTSPSDGGQGDLDPTGCQGRGQKLLSIVGSPNLTVYTGEEVELQVALIEKCVGPLAGESVAFEAVGGMADSLLSSDSAVTESTGLAAVNLLAGEQPATFNVWVTHPDDPDGVYFSVQVKEIMVQLNPVGETNLDVYAGESLDLTVKLVEVESNSPVRGVAIKFSIVPPAPGDASLDPRSANTNLSGMTGSTFHAGTKAVSYQVAAEGEQQQVGKVSYNITVKVRQVCNDNDDCPAGQVCVNGECRDAGGSECATDDQCPDGYVCKDGFCRPEGSLPGSCDTSADCPAGYYCEGHQCYPCDEESELPECEEGLQCETDQDCPPGFICVDGECQRACTPQTCQDLGAECGLVDNGCGQAIDCGDCIPPDTCGGAAVENQCASTDHCKGRECGPDGCGGDCGECPDGLTCNVATGQCQEDCVPQDCDQLGKDCGMVPDGCGEFNDCGECTPPETCGGGGVPNVCGCTPNCVGRECGPDGCEGSCGECPEGSECTADGHCEYLVPEMSGSWYTEHYFDVRDALPGFLQSLAEPMDLLDRWINECDFTGIGIIDDWLCDIVEEYVPEWVGDLIHILNNMFWILSEMRVEGEMEMAHINPRDLLTAVEDWEVIMVRYLDACCEGQGAGCEPHQQPDFPECATIDITDTDLSFGDVGLEVEPFTARVSIDPGPPVEYTLLVDERRVRIEYSEFVGLVIDLLIDIFTPYSDLEDAIMNLIDCEAIQDISDDTCGGLAPDITQVCEDLKPAIADGIYALLDQIGVGWKLMKFSGPATIGVDGDPPYGVTIGYPDHESSRDGFWDGTFTIVFEGDIEGDWWAER